MKSKTFYGNGLTSDALQYQFYIFFKQVQGHFSISWDGYLFMNRIKLTNVLFFISA